ncbi:MAG: aminoglycoside phosphotransferase family protein, partial [Chloroflexi bacterium]
MTHDLGEILRNFKVVGELVDASPYGFGHINDTYAAWLQRADGTRHRILLQRVNDRVFHNPHKLMENIARVTAHLRSRILECGGDPLRETLTLIPTVDDRVFFQDAEGSTWRAYVFIEGARTYEAVASLDQVYHGARAFGRFQNLLSDLPAAELHKTIPDFHNTPKRFDAFMRAVEQDVCNRAAGVRSEIGFILQRAAEAPVLLDLSAGGALPLRVTHNDTKFNNVMIDDRTGEGVCVIDLDTVMPGLALYDVGDCARSATNTVAEDEPDPSRVRFDLAVFEHLVAGYLDAARDFLTQQEIDHIPFAARLMTLECGMRFLADYLAGDVYFKIHRPAHNLDRC